MLRAPVWMCAQLRGNVARRALSGAPSKPAKRVNLTVMDEAPGVREKRIRRTNNILGGVLAATVVAIYLYSGRIVREAPDVPSEGTVKKLEEEITKEQVRAEVAALKAQQKLIQQKLAQEQAEAEARERQQAAGK